MRSLLRFILLFAVLLSTSVLAQEFGWKRLSTAEKPEPQFYGTDFLNIHTGCVVGDSGAIRLTDDGGATWTSVQSGTYSRLTRVRYVTASHLYVTGADGTLLRSLNSGQTWTAIDLKTKMTLNDVYFHSPDTGMVAGQAGFLKVTFDGGVTWSDRDAKFGPNNIYSITFPSRRVGYMCGNQGNISKTTNGGNSWTDLNTGKTTILQAISFGNEKTGIAVGDVGMMLLTTNGGTRWTQVYATIPVTNALNDVQYVDSSLAYMVGWFGVVLKSTDGGRNWEPQEWEGTDVLESIRMLDSKNGFITGYAPVVWTGSVLKTSNGGGIVSADGPSTAPAALDLRSLYPQPISGGAASATVAFSLDRQEQLSILIHDAIGREVLRVADGFYSAGEHTAAMSLCGLTPGTYFARLSTAQTSVVRPFVILP